ncbi:DsbA family oxidoreductase [Halocynthiibacter sp.]|uniref:DsbA family oxidoreductase n=1 Tax=Halocynthiibacter sp. TaxID=1979210 RepID=UPI003C431CA7
MIKLDIISDPICPWCFIGKTYLDRALEKYPDHPFTIEWHPFQLNPDMPAEGMDRRAYLEGKFGGKEGALRAYTPIVEHAKKIGLEINFEDIQRTPNTLDAHRLIHWAGIEGKQTVVKSALLKAYFTDGRDIGNKDVLSEIAEECTMDKMVVGHLLKSDADADDIRQRDTHARERGVTGVPCFIIDNQHVLSGAQPPELWGNVIEEIMEQLENQPADTPDETDEA